MIVPGEFELVYNRLHPMLVEIQEAVELLARGAANEVGGRFLSARVKPAESLYLKLERDGENISLIDIEDLVAATIVISNKSFLRKAETAIRERFDEVETKPEKTRRPEEFIYDDRHMIVRLKQLLNPAFPAQTKVKIEIQIKTEMQAASSAVSRELSYKPRVLSWSRARLASQIRALVDVADDLLRLIDEDRGEDGTGPVPDTNQAYFDEKNRILTELEKSFPAAELPDDRRRLVGVVQSILRDCRPKLRPEEFGDLVRAPQHQTIREATSLSVTQKIFLILLSEKRLTEQRGDDIELYGNRCYLVTSTMEALCPASRAIPPGRRMKIDAPA